MTYNALFTADHDEPRRILQKFIAAEINPFVDEWETNDIFPAHELFKKLGNLGFPPISRGRVVDTLTMTRRKLPGQAASLDALCQKVWDGGRIDQAEALRLYALPLEELGALADRRRQLAKKNSYNSRGNEIVTNNVDRNVNYTNVCNVYCKFCAFDRTEKDDDAYVISLAERKLIKTFKTEKGAAPDPVRNARGQDSARTSPSQSPLGRRSIVGASMILNGQPNLIPMILKSNGRWTGQI